MYCRFYTLPQVASGYASDSASEVSKLTRVVLRRPVGVTCGLVGCPVGVPRTEDLLAPLGHIMRLVQLEACPNTKVATVTNSGLTQRHVNVVTRAEWELHRALAAHIRGLIGLAHRTETLLLVAATQRA